MKQFWVSSRVILLVVVVFVLSAYQVFAVTQNSSEGIEPPTYYVATDGNDNNNGSITQPFRTLY